MLAAPPAPLTQATGTRAVIQDLNFASRAVAPPGHCNLTIVRPPASAPPTALIDKAWRVLARGFLRFAHTACYGAVCDQLRLAPWAVAPSFLSICAHRVSPSVAPESMLVEEARGVPARRRSGHSRQTGTTGLWAVRKDLGLAFWAVSPPGLSIVTKVIPPKPALVSKLVLKVVIVLTRSHCRRGCICRDFCRASFAVVIIIIIIIIIIVVIVVIIIIIVVIIVVVVVIVITVPPRW